jgi:hypothetical protein
LSKPGTRRGKAITRQRRDEAVAPSVPTGRTRDERFSMFHYTTASGLIGIIESKTLWATHANFLNDTAECQLLSALLTPQIKKEFEEIIPKLMERGAFKPEIIQSLGGNALTTESEKVTTAILRAIERVSPIHITSFCMHEVGSPECQHGLLSQWRGYAKGGFAIEFDESQLDDLIDDEGRNHSYQGLISRKVAYDSHEDAAQLEKFGGIAAASLSVAFNDAAPNLAKRPDVSEILGSRVLTDYIGVFINAVPFLKSGRFKEENEYRIVALPTRTKKLIAEAKDSRPRKEISFREGPAGAIVPFIRLFENAGRALPIKKIIVGPHRDQENQLLAARLLLEKYEVDVPVVNSATTLRF